MPKNIPNQIAVPAVLSLCALLFSACGGEEPKTVEVGVVSTGNESSNLATNERLLVCVRSVVVKGVDGSDGNEEEARMPVGLIDASEQNVDWGKMSLPEGMRIQRMRVKVHKSKDLCNVDYSVKYGNATTPQDIEFKFRFDPAIEVKEDQLKTLQLSFQSVIENLERAAINGTISSLKDRVEEVENSAVGRR